MLPLYLVSLVHKFKFSRLILFFAFLSNVVCSSTAKLTELFRSNKKKQQTKNSLTRKITYFRRQYFLFPKALEIRYALLAYYLVHMHANISGGFNPFLKTILENYVLMYGTMALRILLNGQDLKQGPNIFTTSITAMECRPPMFTS